MLQIDTSLYRQVHHRPPAGRGTWVFRVSGTDRTIHLPDMTWAEARAYLEALADDPDSSDRGTGTIPLFVLMPYAQTPRTTPTGTRAGR